MKNVEDIYPLSPLQESLLANLLAGASDAGFEQKTSMLDGALDQGAFERTWQQVVSHHAILRTAFISDGVERPLQVVRRQVELPIVVEDWSQHAEDEQAARRKAWLADDRARGFDPRRAPLMRVALMRLANDRYLLVWSYHHLLLDAWCRNLILQEVFALYQALAEGASPALPASRPFRDYIAWLARQDPKQAAAFWRHHLAGFSAVTDLGLPRPAARESRADPPVGDHLGGLDEGETAALVAFARRQHVTLGTAIQAAWAIVLARYSGQRDVVFGSTVSGRPADLPGVESIRGMFVNNLPMRVEVDGEQPVGAWLRGVHQRLGDPRAFEHSAPMAIQAESDMPWAERLYETLVVVQNSPAEALAGDSDEPEGPLRIASYHGRLETGFPLTLVAVAGARLALRLFFRRARFADGAMERLAGHLRDVLVAMAEDADRPVDAVPMVARPRLAMGDLADTGGHTVASRWASARAATGSAAADPGPIFSCGATTVRVDQLELSIADWASTLDEAGVGPGGVVGLAMTPEVSTFACLLAILHVGAACLPLEPAATHDERRAAWRAAGARWVVAGEAFSRQAGDGLRWLDPPSRAAAADSPGLVKSAATPRSPALALWQPADGGIVLVTHDRLVRWLDALASHLRWQAGDRIAVAPAAAPQLPWRLLLPLTLGAGLRWPSAPDHAFHQANLGRLDGMIVDLEQAVDLVPSPAWGCPSILAWGADVAVGLRATLAVRGTALDVIYGPPEHAFGGLLARPAPDDETIAFTQHGIDLRVAGLCPSEPAPDGRVGPLQVATAGGWRSFGCLARRMPAGGFELVGTRQGAVMIAGRRVEPAVSASVLRRHPDLLAASVVWRQPSSGDGPRLAARVVGVPDARLSVRALTDFLRPRLEPAAVPTTFLSAASSDGAERLLDEEVEAAFRVQAEEVAGAPRNALELRLLRLWERLFGRSGIAVTDDFFALGGHSLLALRLAAEIRGVLGREIALKTVLGARTIRRLAADLDDSEPVTFSPLLVAREGTGPALFCVHPGGGSAACYVDLAHHLPGDEPVYGLQAFGLEPGQRPLERVETMAERYLEAVREVSPAGPYRFAGWSFGGLVAFEMAQQARLSGHDVDLLAWFDTGSRVAAPPPTDDAELILRLIGRDLPLDADALRACGGLDAMLAHTVDVAAEAGLLPAGWGIETAQRIFALRRAHARAAHAYRPRTYDRGGVLFAATDRPEALHAAERADPSRGWSDLCAGEIDVVMVSGAHDTLVLRPHVADLARHLGRRLAGLDAPSAAALPMTAGGRRWS